MNEAAAAAQVALDLALWQGQKLASHQVMCGALAAELACERGV